MKMIKAIKQSTWKQKLLIAGIALISLYVWGQVMTGNTFVTKLIQLPGAYNVDDWILGDIIPVEKERFILLERIHNGPDALSSYRTVESDLFGRSTTSLKNMDFAPYIMEISPNLEYYIQSIDEPPAYAAIYEFKTSQRLANVNITSKTNTPVPTCHWSPSVRYLGCRSTLKEADQWVPVITFFDTEALTYTAPFRIDSTGSPYMYDFSWIDDTTIVMTGSDDESHKRHTGNDENEDASNILYRVRNLFDTPIIERLENLATCIETVYMNDAIYCLRTYDAVKKDQPGSVATWGVDVSPVSHILIRQTLDQKDARSYTVMNPFPFYFGDTMQMNDTYLAVYAMHAFRIFDVHTGKQKTFFDYQYLYAGDENLTSKETTIFGPQNFYQYSAIYRKVDR